MEEKMMQKVNEEMVKDILRNRDKKIGNIHQKMLALYQELEAAGNMQARDILPAIRMDGTPGQKGGHKGLGGVLLGYQWQQYKRSTEIRRMMWALSEQKETVNRVWACFYALEDPYYSILQAIYVENQLYQTVEDSYEFSHKTFEKHRQHGIELVIRFYESGEDIAELMRRHPDDVQKGKKEMAEEEPENNGYDQISLMGYLEGEGKGKKEETAI